MDSVIRPAGLATKGTSAQQQRERRPGIGNRQGSDSSNGASSSSSNCTGSSEGPGESATDFGSSSSGDDETFASGASGSTLSTLTVQSVGRIGIGISGRSRTHRHNRPRLLAAEPTSSDLDSSSSSSASSSASEAALRMPSSDDGGTGICGGEGARAAAGRWPTAQAQAPAPPQPQSRRSSKRKGRGSLLGQHRTHPAVAMNGGGGSGSSEGGYSSSSSTLGSSPYHHFPTGDFHDGNDLRVPLPPDESNLTETMYGKPSNNNTNANANATETKLRTTAQHLETGWKPFLQTPSGHVLTRPDYAAVDDHGPRSRSGSTVDTAFYQEEEEEATPSLSQQHRRNSFNTCASVATASTAADLSVSDEVFSYQNGTARGVLAGLSRRFLRGPWCKLMRRPSFPHHVIPTTTDPHPQHHPQRHQRPPLSRDDAPPRQRLLRTIARTARYQWQRHSKLLILSAVLGAVTLGLSYIPTYESTLKNMPPQGGGGVGDEFDRNGTGGGGDNDYSSPSSAGYQRKVGQLGLIDPHNPSMIAAPTTSSAEGSQQQQEQPASAMAGGYYTIPKEYQILMPSSLGGGASPATNLVRLGPLANIAYVTEPIRETDVPLFWHISRSSGSTMKHILGQCLGLVISSDYGSRFGLDQEDALRVVTADHGGKYVNVDTSTSGGIDRARSMGLVESSMADVIVTQYLYQAATLFNPNQRGRIFAIFRDPIERAVSMKSYLQYAEWEPTYDPALSQMSLLDYARSERVEHNWMTRILSDTLEGSLNANHLELAKAVVRQKTLVGLLSRKGETVARFKEAFGWHDKYPEFEKVVTEEDRKLEMTRAEECADKLLHMDWPNKHGHATIDDAQSPEYAQLFIVNRYDIELYKYAERVFDEQSVLYLPPNGVFFRESRRK